MAIGVSLPDNVTQFPTEVATQAEKDKLNNLGQQISAIVQQFNQLKQQLMSDGNTDRQTKFADLLAQRKAAIEAAMTAWKTKEAQIGTGQQLPALAGLGQVDLTSLQTQITSEQSKLAALQTYYTQYKAAVDAGQQPPAMPAELGSSGFLGISAGTLAMVAAGLAALYFFFMKK